MPVTITRLGIAFNRGVRRDRHGPGIAFTCVGGELDIHERSTAHHLVGNAHGLSSVESGSEIGMQRRVCTDEVDDGIRIGVNLGVENILVPEVVGGKRNKAVEAGFYAQAHLAAGTLSKGCVGEQKRGKKDQPTEPHIWSSQNGQDKQVSMENEPSKTRWCSQESLVSRIPT
jgi:hypothetical protein